MICKRSSSSRTAEKKGEVKVGVNERVSLSFQEDQDYTYRLKECSGEAVSRGPSLLLMPRGKMLLKRRNNDDG